MGAVWPTKPGVLFCQACNRVERKCGCLMSNVGINRRWHVARTAEGSGSKRMLIRHKGTVHKVVLCLLNLKKVAKTPPHIHAARKCLFVGLICLSSS